ncbi:hypothetical protein ACFOD8_15425 [Arthrobacter agilis]|uniref:hypothetical protein n=1 Tax=Arthrobacter agilis TaxID=37921 RepID=UPI00361A29BE
MKLITANLRRYRSIEDGSEFTVETDVTCLVGKNESGKNCSTQGLYKSYPVDKSNLTKDWDYPSRLTRERKEEGKLRVAELTYELDDSEAAKVEARLVMEFSKAKLLLR